MTEYFDDLNKKSDEELIAIADGKIPYLLGAKSTTTNQDIAAEAKGILHKRKSLLALQNMARLEKLLEKPIKKSWHEKAWGKIIIGVIVGLILLVAGLFANRYFTSTAPQLQSPPQKLEQSKQILQKEDHRKESIQQSTESGQEALKVIPVYEPFKNVLKTHEAKLGNPLKDWTRSWVYEAAHDHATVIWVKRLTILCALDTRTGKYIKYRQSYWYPEEEKKWINRKWLLKRFHPPKGCDPPWAGVAYVWDKEGEKWSWIGCRVWHCNYEDIPYQEFKHGIILGGLPLNIANKRDSKLLILTNDGEWESEECEIPPATCIPPKEE